MSEGGWRRHAATTLAGLTSAGRLAQGARYPSLADLRPISRAIAIAVAREAHESDLADSPGDDIEAAVVAAMWQLDYPPSPAREPLVPRP
jgi:malic enzyme